MSRHRLAAAALAAVLGLSALGSAGARTRGAYHGSITEVVTETYYLDSGITHSGTYTTEGRTIGCGWDVPDGALATFSNGDQFICEDKGLTGTAPWADFFAWSDADGWALVYGHADACPAMCYGTVRFDW